MRPYRYSIIHKDIVDKLVEEMLNQGIIWYSKNPYASPVVLVKKKRWLLVPLCRLQEAQPASSQR